MFTGRYVLPTQHIYVFCVDLRTNSDYWDDGALFTNMKFKFGWQSSTTRLPSDKE